jgi:hypothetical protein
MLTNIRTAPAEGKDSRGKAIKPQIVTDCNHHMVYGKQHLHRPSHMEVNQEIILLSVRSGHHEQLHSYFLMWD